MAGTENPTAQNVRNILDSVGAEIDDTILNKLISEMAGKSVSEVISSGMSKLELVSSASAGRVAATSNTEVAEQAADTKQAEQEVEEEEEEGDLGFSLFD